MHPVSLLPSQPLIRSMAHILKTTQTTSHLRAVSMANIFYFEMNASQIARRLDTKDMKLDDLNTYWKNKTGIEGEFFTTDPARIALARGQRFLKTDTALRFIQGVKRFAQPKGMETNNALLKGMKFAPEVAAEITQTYKRLTEPDQVGNLIGLFDDVQNWWKAQVLVAPAFHTRNFLSNMFNNWLGGVNDPSAYVKAASFMGRSRKGTLNATEKVLFGEMQRLGVIDRGFFAGEVIEKQLPSQASKFNPLSSSFFVFKANRKVGSLVENHSRVTHFLDKINKGLSPADAAFETKKYLFDFTDQGLTATERKVFKRIMPFYTWTRKNFQLQIEQLFSKPAKQLATLRLLGEVERRQKKGPKELPDFLKNRMTIKVGQKGKEGDFLPLSGFLPIATLAEFGTLQSTVDSLASLVSPLIKGPIELAANFDSFRKKPIEAFPGEVKSVLRLPVSARTKYLLGNIRVIGELDKILGERAIDQTDREKILSVIFGLRLSTVDLRKLKNTQRHVKAVQRNKVRFAIKLATKRKDFKNRKNLKELERKLDKEIR